MDILLNKIFKGQQTDEFAAFLLPRKSLIHLFWVANKSYFYLFLGNLIKFLPKHFLLSFYFRNFGGRNKK